MKNHNSMAFDSVFDSAAGTEARGFSAIAR